MTQGHEGRKTSTDKLSMFLVSDFLEVGNQPTCEECSQATDNEQNETDDDSKLN